MKPLSELLYGSRLKENQVPQLDSVGIHIRGEYNQRASTISITPSQLSKNVLFIGGTGSGKTNAINLFLREIRTQMTDDDVMIVFDTKGDYEREFFDESKGDVVIGNSAQYRDRSQIWNIYEDALIDGWRSESAISININEMARILFEKNKSEAQPFFTNAARGIFCAQMLAIVRGAMFDKSLRTEQMNNRALIDFFNRATKESYQLLSESFEDMRKIQIYLGDTGNSQALGVLAEIQVMLQDTFIGIFGESGSFSIRNFVRQRGGKTLFLEYDLSIGETLAPLYSLLMNLALKEALGRNASGGEEGKVYIVIDEMKLLPLVKHLDDAVNFGRSMGVSVLAGLQSMTQIHDMYGNDKGEAILSGFCSLLAFRPNDAKTREYIQSRFGKNMVNEIFDANQRAVSERRQGHVVEDWDLSGLNIGESVVGIDGSPPFLFKFDRF